MLSNFRLILAVAFEKTKHDHQACIFGTKKCNSLELISHETNSTDSHSEVLRKLEYLSAQFCLFKSC